jgi:hypothetical protein
MKTKVTQEKALRWAAQGLTAASGRKLNEHLDP